MLSIVATDAFAKTLIVTHANRFYDRSAIAGENTRRLLLDDTFTRRIFLNTSSAVPPSFSPDGLEYEERVSTHGELDVDFTESKFVFAGAYWGSCLTISVNSVINRFGHDLELNFAMNAVLVGTPNFRRLLGTNGIVTLAEIRSVLGKGALEDVVVRQIAKLLENGTTFTDLNLREKTMKNPNYRIDVFINNEHVRTLGDGTQLLRFNFF